MEDAQSPEVTVVHLSLRYRILEESLLCPGESGPCIGMWGWRGKRGLKAVDYHIYNNYDLLCTETSK